MSETLKLFKESKYYSTKHIKYFKNYDEILFSYKDKEITFVEIGILNGGSLSIWKKFLGDKARIIGIDLNPECKKFEKDGFEIFIGSQSDPKFWENFFNIVGKVDVILDDGGHTNLQQISTLVNCVPHIKDGGILITEDTHTSYMDQFANPSKYSFINFSKKLIDDINYTFPNIGKSEFSLNKYIYSIEYFESIVVFKIDLNRCYFNEPITNNQDSFNHLDYRYGNNKKINYLKNKLRFLKRNILIKKLSLICVNKFLKYYKILKNSSETKIYKKYFK
tara:strand:- start:373 stop:1206 length:834 start_codon:yes stop_codon:yes gene_type:complete